MDSAEREQLFGQVVADYLKAIERGENPDRAAIVAAQPELAEELESFFANHDRMQATAQAAFELHRGLELEATLPPGSSATASGSANGNKPNRPPRERIGYFGDYELLAEIARGGMGVVYRARQVNLDRTVALKMILAGQLASPEDVRRFYQEAEAAASLEHPGIVPVFEVGQHAQQHFFSMGFVEGPNLAQVLTAGPLPPQQAATIVKLVADAIAYAHDRGVIHRDLKPANVLLAKVDGDSNHRVQQTVPLQTGSIASGHYQPKVTDFGLAKRTESGNDGLTGTGQIIGTPSYMSPEQASGRINDVAPSSDVYSLGAILYAALTGHPPFQSDSPLNIVRQVLEQEPISPRQANNAVPRDLETICLKCLEKDRRKRYSSARELADELQRFLQGEPIRARRISSVERAWRWCRRKPALATVFALLALIALALSIGGPWLAYKEREALIVQEQLRRRAEVERQNALEEQKKAEKARNNALQEQDRAQRAQARAALERHRAQQNLVASQLLLGQVARENADQAESLAWYLQAYLNSAQGSETRNSGLNLLGAWSRTIEQTIVHDSPVHEMAISQDGKIILAGYLGGGSRLWNRDTGLPQGAGQRYAGDFVSAVISPDGSFALTSDWDAAQVWDSQTGKQRYQLTHFVREDTVVGPALSPDGETILTRTAIDEIRLWNVATGKPLCPPRKHGEYVHQLSFSLDSKFALSLSDDTAQLWNSATGEPVGPQIKGLVDIAFHPDGKRVAFCTKDSDRIIVRETATDKQVVEMTAPAKVLGVEFDRAGENLLARGEKDAYLWRSPLTPDAKLVTLEHERGLFAATFGSSDSQVLTASPRLVQVWQSKVVTPLWKRTISGGHFFDRKMLVTSARFSPSGDSVLAITQNGTAEVLGARFGELLVRENKVQQAEFTADGKTLVVASNLGWMRFRPIHPELPTRLAGPPAYPGLSRVVYSPGGELACVVYNKNKAQVCRANTLEPIGEPIQQEAPIHGVALSPDGKLLVLEEQLPKPPGSPLFSNTPGRLQFWDVATREPVGEPIALPNNAYYLRFDPSGRTLHASAVLIDVPTRQIIPIPQDNQRGDRRTVVSLTSWFRTPLPELRDATNGEVLWQKLPKKSLGSSFLTQDGKRLFVQTPLGEAQVLDAETLQPLSPKFHPVGSCLARSADGRYAVYGDLRTLRIWDTTLGRPCGEPLMNEQANAHLAFSPDGRQLVTNWHAVARVWDSATGQPLCPILGQNSTGGEFVQFSPNGKEFQLKMASTGFHRWQTPQPAKDEPERLQLSVEVRTGLTVENAVLRKLSQNEWLAKKSRLSELGGPCDAIDPSAAGR